MGLAITELEQLVPGPGRQTRKRAQVRVVKLRHIVDSGFSSVRQQCAATAAQPQHTLVAPGYMQRAHNALECRQVTHRFAPVSEPSAWRCAVVVVLLFLLMVASQPMSCDWLIFVQLVTRPAPRAWRAALRGAPRASRTRF